MVIHDLKCEQCGLEQHDAAVTPGRLEPCESCGGVMEIRWDISRRPIAVAMNPTLHPSDRVVVYRNPKTGNIAYPGANNQPMPERYRKDGYERLEMTTANGVKKFCKENKVRNERLDFDSNGTADRHG